MRKMLICLQLLVVFTLYSCTTITPPQSYDFKKEKEFSQEKNKIWEKTIEFLMKYKMLPGFTEKASGIIRYDGDLMEFQGLKKDVWNGDRLIKPILDCGSAGIDKIPLQYKNGEIMIYIKEINQSTCTVYVECKRTTYDKIQGDIICVSTGNFEKELFDYLSK